MVHLLFHIRVEDYKRWKPFFDEHATARSQGGSKGGKVFRSANDPNEIFILLEWDNLENGKKFSQSDKLKEVMKNAGVVGMPEIHFLEEAAVTSK